MEKLLSICIPTNGVVDWLKIVLESIYSQDVDEELYEVVVCDNGDEDLLMDFINKNYYNKKNLIYRKSETDGFLNQIECFKLARGKFIKFLNHRAKLNEGSIEKLIDFVKSNDDSSVVFFSNGSLKNVSSIEEFDDFDKFVRSLSIYSSWSGGLGIWRSHLNGIVEKKQFNVLFPHTDILFFNKKASKYIIDNNSYFSEIDTTHERKGRYNVFYAFGVVYPNILLNLYLEKQISLETLNFILDINKKFLINLYRNFIILKKPCSYDLMSYKKYLNVFYNEKNVKFHAFFPPFFRRI